MLKYLMSLGGYLLLHLLKQFTITGQEGVFLENYHTFLDFSFFDLFFFRKFIRKEFSLKTKSLKTDKTVKSKETAKDQLDRIKLNLMEDISSRQKDLEKKFWDNVAGIDNADAVALR